MNLVHVKLNENVDPSVCAKFDELAFTEFNCEGKHEYSMVEEQVDNVLGKEAFCGGELEERFYDLIESEMNKQNKPSYFWREENLKEAKRFSAKIRELGHDNSLESVEEEDWNESWRKGFNKIEINDELSVVPSWEDENAKPGDILIYPGMGFGTGNHETTFLIGSCKL